MKLYYGLNACSLAPLIVATEAGIPLDLEKVDIYGEPHTLFDGTDFSSVNSRLYVPVLELDDGSRMTEAAVLLQYIADLAPEARLVPPRASRERYGMQEWLNFIATEFHKAFSPWLFNTDIGDAAHEAARARIAARLASVETTLAGTDFLLGEFSAADAYLFTILKWAESTAVPLDEFPNVRAWRARIADRPAVREATRRHV